MNKKTLGYEILKRLRKESIWNEVLSMTKALSATHLLVGGRVYRTALEIVHGGDFGSANSDWDFLCTDMTNQNVQFNGWTKVRGPGAVKNNWTKYQNASSAAIVNRHVSPPVPIQYPSFIPQNAQPILQKRTPPKVIAELSCKYVKNGTLGANEVALDLISLDGLAQTLNKNVSPATYFEDVPLNIQAIALDLSLDSLIGHGFEAIFNKKILLNGTNPTTIMGGDVERYARAKAESLKCEFVPMKKTNGQDCVCDIKLLLHKGCKCGFLEMKKNATQPPKFINNLCVNYGEAPF